MFSLALQAGMQQQASKLSDTTVIPAAAAGFIKGASQRIEALSPEAGWNKLKGTASGQVNQARSTVAGSMKKIKHPAFTFNLSLEDATRYQPVPSLLSAYPNQKFISEFSIRGGVQAWGIPLNLNFTNAQATVNPLGSAIRNNLFKFDFDPRQLASEFKSDLQQYYDLRKSAFAGMDISTYAQRAVMEKMRSEGNALSPVSTDGGQLSKFLGSKANVAELLKLNEQQLRQKLTAVASSRLQLPGADIRGGTSLLSALARQKLVTQAEAIRQQAQLIAAKELKGNTSLIRYINDPAKLEELRHMDEQQIKSRLMRVVSDHRTPGTAYLNNLKVVEPLTGMDFSKYISTAIRAKSEAKQEQVENLAYKIASSQLKADPISAQELLSISAEESERIRSEKTARETGDAVTAITGIKEQLSKQGIDIGKVLLMQNFLDGKLPATEETARYFEKKPANALQSVFTKFQALKIGAYGTKVPGGTLDQDIFMKGTSVTFKTNNTPISLGYGTVNDLSSVKDAAFQSSVYNSPKNITYIGAETNTSAYGKVKIAVVSSFNNTNLSSNYAMPTIQGNSTAVTLSRAMDIGAAGSLLIDVSKSNSLYNNNYVPGSEVILAKRAGLVTNSTADLFQSAAIGFTQHLEIKELNMSDNVYFNYSGMGYQNPGNNGYGGARMKMGGNLRKALYKNKLILNLRTDIRNMPISYTSNDQWKNYQVMLDSRYQVNKKFTVSLKYSANGTSKKVDDISSQVYSFQKLQADGNLSYKIGKNNTVSHFSISKQDYSNSYVSQSAGNMLMFNYTQSLLLHKNAVTATVLYNKELSAYKLIGNMLNSDISYQYMLFNKVSLSTGATYLDNTGIARQAGLRQSVRLAAGKHFDFDTYVDLRKNMIASLYPDLYAACRVELMLRYHL